LKKIIILATTIGVLILSLIGYGYSENLLQTVKTLPLGTTVTEARKRFEDFQLSNVQELHYSQGIKTFFSYENGEEEEVRLEFRNNELCGFEYQNKKIREKELPPVKEESSLTKGPDKMITFADSKDIGKVENCKGNIAEIRGALAIILGNAELLLRQEQNISEEAKNKLEQIKSEVFRIDNLL